MPTVHGGTEAEVVGDLDRLQDIFIQWSAFKINPNRIIHMLGQ